MTTRRRTWAAAAEPSVGAAPPVGGRWPVSLVWPVSLLWPVGLLLTGAHTGAGAFSTPLFVALDAGYVVAAVLLVRRAITVRAGVPPTDFLTAGSATTAGSTTTRATTALALPMLGAGLSIFVIASLTGIPTARHPAAMIGNTAVLLLAGTLVLVGTVAAALRVWDGPGRTPAGLALAAVGIGSAGYLANLSARVAVVVSGASPAQATVEDTAWQAHEYLTGLSGEPSWITLLLVWLDLLQVGHLVLAYLASAALATALRRADLLPERTGRAVSYTGTALAAATVVGAALAITGGGFDAGVPSAMSDAAAWLTFGLTIPFMSTLLPFATGVGLLFGTRKAPSTPGKDHHRKDVRWVLPPQHATDILR